MKLPDENVCFHTDTNFATHCQLRQKDINFEIIIPMFDTLNMKSCTAVFDLTNATWSKIVSSERFFGFGGHLIRYLNNKIDPTEIIKIIHQINCFSLANQSRILYLGGMTLNGSKTDSIYELIDYTWTLWPVKLPEPIGNDIVTPIPSNEIKKCKPPPTKIGKL